MPHLTTFDATRWGRTPFQRAVVQLLFGVGCAAVMIMVRALLDEIAPTAGPFALVYPAVIVATLYGRLHAGLVALAISVLWAWWWVLPPVRSFETPSATELWRVAINVASALLVMVLAESFRGAVEQAAHQKGEEIARRKLIFAEFEHRTRNNFSLVLSLLEIQRRRETPDGIRALDEAKGRISCFGDIYSHVLLDTDAEQLVAIKPYLENLVERISTAMFSPEVRITTEIEELHLGANIAASMGLWLNEALTNCAKYAFPEQADGKIAVSLIARDGRWTLTVKDNGIGDGGQRMAKPSSGQGRRIMDAFAQRAGASHQIALSPSGCSAELAGAL